MSWRKAKMKEKRVKPAPIKKEDNGKTNKVEKGKPHRTIITRKGPKKN